MDSKDILRRVGERLNQKNEESKKEKTQLETERRNLVTSIGQDIVEAIIPYMQSMADRSQVTKEDIKAALSEVQINVPESNVHIPEFKIPTPQVTVNVPEMKIPEVRIPETKFPDRMSVGLENYSNKTPMPVMMVDTKGNPFQFTFPATSGGKQDFFTVKGITNTIGIVSINPDGSPAGAGSVASSVSVSDIFSTVGANVVNPDGRIKVELPTGSSGLTDTELRASSVPVEQASGAMWSTTVYDVFQTTVASSVINPDNRVKVELPTGSSGLTDTELRATAVPVSQVSGVSFSISATDIFATTATSVVVNPDNRVRVELPATTVTGITNTVATANVDSTGVQYSGSNPLPVYSANTLDVRQVSGSINSVYVTGSSGTTAVVGDIASDVADTESNPVKTGGIARTANPTAVANGDRVSTSFDDLGRQVMRPVQVRDLILTAYVSVANGTETTLRAAVTGAYLDLIFLKGSNNSDAAVSVDIRAVTGGNIIDTLRIPANGTAGYTPTVPWPQDETGNNWTVDGPDETGRTLTFSALFSQEI